jgi:hypothetical protein
MAAELRKLHRRPLPGRSQDIRPAGSPEPVVDQDCDTAPVTRAPRDDGPPVSIVIHRTPEGWHHTTVTKHGRSFGGWLYDVSPEADEDTAEEAATAAKNLPATQVSAMIAVHPSSTPGSLHGQATSSWLACCRCAGWTREHRTRLTSLPQWLLNAWRPARQVHGPPQTSLSWKRWRTSQTLWSGTPSRFVRPVVEKPAAAVRRRVRCSPDRSGYERLR